MEIGQTVRLAVDGVASQGQGVARHQGMAVFVDGALPGDVAEAEICFVGKRYAQAKIMRIVSPSPQRQEPPCPYFAACGGCVWQNAKYEAQLEYKRQIVAGAIRRIAHISVEVPPVVASPAVYGYRNRSTWHWTPAGERSRFSLFAAGSHDFGGGVSCILAEEPVRETAAALENILLPLANRFSALRHITVRGNRQGQTVAILTAAGDLPQLERIAPQMLQTAPRLTALWLNDGPTVSGVYGRNWHLLAGAPDFYDHFASWSFQVPPGAFLQVNRAQSENLLQWIGDMAALQGRETVWDVYGGVGVIGVSLAAAARRVIGIESYEPAAQQAAANAALNGSENCRFYAGKAEKICLDLAQKADCRPQVIVVDPPRSGCDAKVIQALCKSGAERIIYVSCNPATLARDLAQFTAQGYTVRRLQPFDMFPQTCHVECVTLMMKAG
ncbi:MAG: 23S rRNA (uracil(1939)-C(5))-methyltransferase RlmD [Firmicutes bacterium]|nr:23S rRNA (uracil(1939)-C(5))-methyltransferase RlmD [Bacillota bacterium]